MTTPVSSRYKELGEVQLRGMIRATEKQFPFLEPTSEDALYKLARTMIDTDFMIDRPPTPVRSSLEFLRAILEPEGIRVMERDFVFLIKMFGLRILDKEGLYEFWTPSETRRQADGEKAAVEVYIEDREQAKVVEFVVSQVQKPRKIHLKRIDAAVNRLARRYRDTVLAHHFVSLVNDGKTIGEAKDVLRIEHSVKDHEYNRVRERAMELGIFDPSRNKRSPQSRVTLDPDVMEYVQRTAEDQQGSRMHKKSTTQMVNQMLRDFHFLTKKVPLVPPPKSKKRAGKVSE
ncbi:hypothetical protein [Ralstonia sp. ASV6]|uniref:hypothetical protein n=1 Tax=Ralstonia sp. ASV6 TaxID=2795124 RepID=UPI0018ED9308|nr:hypothetical protein [Ralstonia sp. ASV6]